MFVFRHYIQDGGRFPAAAQPEEARLPDPPRAGILPFSVDAAAEERGPALPRVEHGRGALGDEPLAGEVRELGGVGRLAVDALRHRDARQLLLLASSPGIGRAATVTSARLFTWY